MINEVRNTVMAVLNKDNNGYITPTEFNLFAKQAQLELFEEYFYDYNNWLINQNQGNGRETRLVNSGYADIPRSYEQVIDSFASITSLSYATIQIDVTGAVTGTFSSGDTVSQAGSGATGVVTGYTTASGVKTLRLTGVVGNFDTTNVITSSSGATLAAPMTVSNADNFQLPSDWYYINLVRSGGTTEVEQVSHIKLLQAISSVLVAPSATYPIYYQQDNYVNVSPSTIVGAISVDYVRYPKDPNWTSSAIGADGDPVFDQSSADYQDFELPLSDSTTLTFKILQYAGVNIRETEVTQFGTLEEATEDKIES